MESGDLSDDDMCLLVSSEQEISLPFIVPSVRPSLPPPTPAPSLPRGPEGMSMSSSSVPDLEPTLVTRRGIMDSSVASEGIVPTVRAHLRSNVHHLPETMGDRGGIVNSQITVTNNVSTLFRPWS